MSRVVIVGASVAGVHTAEALRGGGFDGTVLLVGDEKAEPYDRPALSKQMLTGDWRPDALALLPGSRAAELGVELRLGSRAVRLDTSDRTVWLADDTAIGYDQLVISTGSHARKPTWAVSDGIFTLRTLADSARLRRALLESRRVVVVGAGFIGGEVAAAAQALGCEVTVIDPLNAPMARLLGAEIGGLLGDVHERHGVNTRFNIGVKAAEGHLGDMSVILDDGSTIAADLVIAGVGASPNESWLTSSSLALGDGVLCDQYCRVLEHDGIYAAGDVARWYDPRLGRSTRVEHWTNAVEQGAHVAQNIVADVPTAYRPLHYVWSDQYDWKLQFVSTSDSRHSYEILGDFASSSPAGVVAFGDEEGRFVAALTLNHPHALMNSRRMLRTGWSFGEAVRTLKDSVSKRAG